MPEHISEVKKFALFDLDGTLIESYFDILVIWNVELNHTYYYY